MTEINRAPNLAHPDEIFHALNKVYAGLDVEDATAFSARLIFALANHIGDSDVVLGAIALAKRTG